MKRWSMTHRASDSKVPTFTTPVVSHDKGLLYVGTWDGAVLQLVLDSGTELDDSWSATGQPAYAVLHRDRCACFNA
jgi:hypothetical protein